MHFKKRSSFDAALRRSRNKMGTKKVTVIKARSDEVSQLTAPSKGADSPQKPRPWEYKVINHITVQANE